MRYPWRLLVIVAGVMVVLPLLLGGLSVAFGVIGGGYIFAGLVLVYGWVILAFFHYRHARQEEVRLLLATAADNGLPLDQALRAYRLDRPRDPLRDFWVAAGLFVILPGYYWIWHRRHQFDRKVERVVERLRQGASLYQALWAEPGVAAGDTRLAVAIGEATGRLGPCLHKATGGRLTPLWLQALPRLFYPLALLLFMAGVLTFLMLFIAPKFQKIFSDFKMRLPTFTEQLFVVAGWFSQNVGLVVVLVLWTLLVTGVVLFSSTVRWYLPGLGRLYRWHTQGRVLKGLGVLLEGGKTVPEALAMLADSGTFGGTVRRRLQAARDDVNQGQPLAEALRRHKLLTRSMTALVQAAERAGNLPWALGELGENQAIRTVRLANRLALALFPVGILCLGVLVGGVVLGFYWPFLQLLEGVSRW